MIYSFCYLIHLKNVRSAQKHKNAMKYEIGRLVWLLTILELATWTTTTMLDLAVGVETNAEMKTCVNLLYGWKEIVIPITKIAYNLVKISNFCFSIYYTKFLIIHI